MARLGTANFKHPTYTPHVHSEVWKACVYKEASTGTHLESASFADVAGEGVGRFVTTSQMAQEQVLDARTQEYMKSHNSRPAGKSSLQLPPGIDRDGDGQVSMDEFMEGMRSRERG
mmetsp:Transcript_4407/g.6755  ORF Transcript_4407/g.6755 Transcript_4407/m.6755 type:complete len:116 (+) Transcript_4407:38-385(+)